MQNQCNLNVRSKCILNAFRIRKGNHLFKHLILSYKSKPVSIYDFFRRKRSLQPPRPSYGALSMVRPNRQ